VVKPKSTGITREGLGVEGLKPGPIIGALVWEFLSGFSWSKNLGNIAKAVATTVTTFPWFAFREVNAFGLDQSQEVQHVRSADEARTTILGVPIRSASWDFKAYTSHLEMLLNYEDIAKSLQRRSVPILKAGL
jgi:hypothetical protein